MARRVDERGFPLSEDEQIEIDEKAKKITDSIFGQSHGTNVPEQLSVPKMPKIAKNEGAMAAGVTEKKKPGRPKRTSAVPEETKSREDLPQIVRDMIEEKVDVLERLIRKYEQDIEETRSELERKIRDLDARKKDAAEKIAELSAFMGGD